MKGSVYFCGISKAELRQNLEKWLKNPDWREYYETAPSDRCRLMISVEFWESEYDPDKAADAVRYLEEGLSAEDWKHLYRYCGNNPRKGYIHDRIMDLELKDQFELMTDIRVHPDRYYPLVDHAERHFDGRTETGDVNIGWNVGLLEGNRPWFGECWATEGITMLTYFVSARDMEDRTPGQLGRMLEEAGVVRFADPERDNTPAVRKITDGKGGEFFSVNITAGVGDETYTTGDSGIVHSFRELNRFNEKVFPEMAEAKREAERKRDLIDHPLYPCHLYGIGDANEAYKEIHNEYLKGYGARLALEDGTVLHDNYPGHHDEGDRCLVRCKACGCLKLVQKSMDECPYWDMPDLYFRDGIPVASVEEADLLNILWDEEELKKESFRHLQRDDMRKCWTEGKDPSPYDPEELKEKIRAKYAGLTDEQKGMLEKLIGEAGKKTEDEFLTPEEELFLGDEYNNRGWALQTGEHPDPEEAASWYRKAAALGNTLAMVNLGNLCEEQGKLMEAYGWYRDAANAGDDTGRFNQARMFFHGKGVNRDYKEAYRYFKELYEKGYGAACLYMGLYAENGFLGKPNFRAAAKYYRKGIKEGDEYCPVNLGRMYCSGTGVPEDLKKGFELYMLGWERGDALAATNIGYCYETGQGVRKNRRKAIEYYTYAAEKGEENAAEALKRLKGKTDGRTGKKK